MELEDVESRAVVRLVDVLDLPDDVGLLVGELLVEAAVPLQGVVSRAGEDGAQEGHRCSVVVVLDRLLELLVSVLFLELLLQGGRDGK